MGGILNSILLKWYQFFFHEKNIPDKEIWQKNFAYWEDKDSRGLNYLPNKQNTFLIRIDYL